MVVFSEDYYADPRRVLDAVLDTVLDTGLDTGGQQLCRPCRPATNSKHETPPPGRALSTPTSTPSSPNGSDPMSAISSIDSVWRRPGRASPPPHADRHARPATPRPLSHPGRRGLRRRQRSAALDRAGHEVLQVTLDNPTEPGAAVAALARSVHNRAIRPLRTRAHRRVRPDVVHVHNTWFALSSSAVAAAAGTGVPVAMTVHNFRLGCLSTDLFRDGAVCTACVGRAPLPGVLHGCYRGSRALSALQATEVIITRRRGVIDRVVTQIRRAIAVHGRPPRRHRCAGQTARSSSRTSSTTPDVAPLPRRPRQMSSSSGRLAEGKGVETLLEAWATADVSKRENRRLQVIGDGPLADDLRQRLPVGVEMLGWMDRDEIRRPPAARPCVGHAVRTVRDVRHGADRSDERRPPRDRQHRGRGRCDRRCTPGAARRTPRSGRPRRWRSTRLDDATVDSVGAANRRRFEQCYSEAGRRRRARGAVRRDDHGGAVRHDAAIGSTVIARSSSATTPVGQLDGYACSREHPTGVETHSMPSAPTALLIAGTRPWPHSTGWRWPSLDVVQIERRLQAALPGVRVGRSRPAATGRPSTPVTAVPSPPTRPLHRREAGARRRWARARSRWRCRCSPSDRCPRLPRRG